jgi:Cu-processing system permease protein
MNNILILANHTVKALIRKKDLYVFLIMLGVLIVSLLFDNFFGFTGISRHAKDIGYFFLWMFSFIIAITFSARQLPDEIKNRTVLSLLAKPITRTQLLMGRYLGSLYASATAYSCFLALYALSVYFRGEGMNSIVLIQAYLMGLYFLVVITAVTVLLSLLLTLSAAVTFSFVLYFAIMWFSEPIMEFVIRSKGIISTAANIIYYILPHYEFYDMRVRLAHSWDSMPMWVILFATLYTLLYSGCILYIADKKLKKRFL